jgi:hypothetical protein
MKFGFEDLDVWKIALDFAEKVHLISKNFPKDEIMVLLHS